MRTADDDSGPVPHDALKLPRAVLVWKTPRPRGGVWSPQPDELAPEDTLVTRLDPLSGSRSSARASSDSSDSDPTIAIRTPISPPTPERTDPPRVARARAAAHVGAALARAAKLWRDGPPRTAAAVAGAVLITYLAMGGARRGTENRAQTTLVPPAAPPAVAPIIVEQLNGALQPRARGAAPLRAEQSNGPERRSAGGRQRAASVARAPARTSDQELAPAQSKPSSRRAESSGTTVSSGSAGLPPWGVDAVRDFSNGKSSAGAGAPSHSHALTAKPTSSNADIPPPMAAYRSGARKEPQAAPVVATKPAEPSTPVVPPRPSKPLTMDELLNRVEEAARAQRKQAGLKAPKTGKHDTELGELINGAMRSKK